MVDFLRWSFVIALIPLALDLAWNLISVVANGITLRLSRPARNADPRVLADVNRTRSGVRHCTPWGVHTPQIATRRTLRPDSRRDPSMDRHDP